MSPKRIHIISAVCILAALGLAFLFGKFSNPAKVVTEVQTVTVEKVVEKVVEKRVEVAAAARVVYIDRVIEKDGTVKEHIEAREETKTETREEKHAEKEATKEDERKSITVKENHATARVSLLAGVDFAPAWQPIPNAGPLTLGVHVEYRVAGPVNVGAWGLLTGAVGVSVGVEF